MNKNDLQQGIALLSTPVLPLVSMVQFLFLTGPFETVAEVIGELPEPIETGHAVYATPRALLREYQDLLLPLEGLKNGEAPEAAIVDSNGRPVDPMTGTGALVLQQVLSAELERINSLLCAPCDCSLCCIGPDETMAQEFFEIPLTGAETALFPVERCRSGTIGARCAMDPEPVLVNGRPFYDRSDCALFHWRNGWSLILPRSARCPNLEPDSGRCRVYGQRPGVCRRPQIFAYILEPLEEAEPGGPAWRLRNSLLAIVDCPYVNLLRDEIAAYGAACELDVIFKQNKA